MNWALLQNSLLVAATTTLAAVVVGGSAAVFLSGIRRAWRRVLLALSLLALVLPPFLVTNCWLDLLGQGGLWRAWIPFNIFTLGGTVWILTLLLWPIALILGLGGLQKLQPSQLESEPALRSWPLIRWLLLPAAWPGLVQAAVLIFVLAFNNFAVPAILQTKVFPAELWVSFNTTFDYRAALLLSWPMVVVPVGLLIWLGRAPIAWPRTQGGVPPSLFRQRLGPTFFTLTGCLTVCVAMLSVAVPISELVMSRRTWTELPAAFAAGQSAVRNSFVFATLGSTACVLLGLALWRRRAGAALWVLLLLPGVLLGIALIFVLNRPPLTLVYQSVAVVILALGLRYAALGWGGARHSMRMVDANLLDFARLNGASRWQLFRHVRWPQVAPEIAAVWLIIYLLCLWDVETLILIIPPGCETLALRIFNLLHYGHNAQVNALCLLLLGLAVLPSVAWTVMTVGRRFQIGPVTGKLALTGVLSSLLLVSGCQPVATNKARVGSKIFCMVEVIGSRGTALGQFNKPRSVAVDSDDNLYVVDMTGRVQKFSPDGKFLLSWQMPQTDLGKPKGMCRDKTGDIIVIEPHYSRVNHFSPEGKLLSQWGEPGTNSGQLCLPRAVATNARGDLWVCEYSQVDRVQRFSAKGKQWLATIGRSGLGDGEFNRPEGLGVDARDCLYVADSCNHRIQVFSPEGRFLRSYGHAGRRMGELSYPYDVQVDADGFQFVAEFGNSRIQVFDPEGKPVEIIGGPGSAPGQFSNPWSEALDSAGNLYVADSQNHRVQKFIRTKQKAESRKWRTEG